MAELTESERGVLLAGMSAGSAAMVLGRSAAWVERKRRELAEAAEPVQHAAGRVIDPAELASPPEAAAREDIEFASPCRRNNPGDAGAGQAGAAGDPAVAGRPRPICFAGRAAEPSRAEPSRGRCPGPRHGSTDLPDRRPDVAPTDPTGAWFA